MDDYISISMLNDYIFCPYSIYLHNVYADTDESLYHAEPQLNGRMAHRTVDNRTAMTDRGDVLSLEVCSDELGVVGKIDVYRRSTKTLVERKYRISRLFRGQIYQLWAQYCCMKEMGYEVERLAFYETSANKTYEIPLPDENGIRELKAFIEGFRLFNPESDVTVNINKCRHCIYCNLCDKINLENVYS